MDNVIDKIIKTLGLAHFEEAEHGGIKDLNVAALKAALEEAYRAGAASSVKEDVQIPALLKSSADSDALKRIRELSGMPYKKKAK